MGPQTDTLHVVKTPVLPLLLYAAHAGCCGMYVLSVDHHA